MATEYIPFDTQWYYEMMRWTKADLAEAYGVSTDQLKREMVAEIRSKLILGKFNKAVKIGDTFFWRKTPYDEPQPVTLKREPFLHYGQPVAFVEEFPAFLAIDPEHVPDVY